MITTTLARLQDKLDDVEQRLAFARRVREPSPAVIAMLQDEAAALRDEIAEARRRRLDRRAG